MNEVTGIAVFAHIVHLHTRHYYTCIMMYVFLLFYGESPTFKTIETSFVRYPLKNATFKV